MVLITVTAPRPPAAPAPPPYYGLACPQGVTLLFWRKYI